MAGILRSSLSLSVGFPVQEEDAHGFAIKKEHDNEQCCSRRGAAHEMSLFTVLFLTLETAGILMVEKQPILVGRISRPGGGCTRVCNQERTRT